MSEASKRESEAVSRAALPLERDWFLRSMVRELAGTLEDVVGLDDAAGFVSVVGTALGEEIDRAYRNALNTERLSADQVAAVLVDLKRRIKGDFFVIEHSDDRLVLGNNACPFGDKVVDRPSMCMMTSNVFGHIAARNLGYAKVELAETIAKRAPGCRVIVHLAKTERADDAEGREYFGSPAR